jgi:hypothetical protein
VTWAFWLAVPVVVTLLAAVLSWLRARPARPLDTDRAMRAHGDYLDALARTPRAKDVAATEVGRKAPGATDPDR